MSDMEKTPGELSDLQAIDETGADQAEVLRLTIGPAAPDRLDKALAALVPEGFALSRSRIAKMLAAGDISRDGTAVTEAKTRPIEGETYVLRLAPPEDLDVAPENIPLEVVWEDAALIVVNKPAGMVVHPAPGTTHGTLVNALLHHCGDSLSGIGGAKRPGIVHRIDKDTTGLLVAAKSDRAHQGLARQFADHSVTRRYLALTHGAPSAADPRLRGLRGVAFEPGGILRIATHLARHPTDRQRQAVVWEHGRHAITRARVVESFGPDSSGGAVALVECWLETGRTHQIRVHMAYAGHGLIGDATYGGARKLNTKALGVEVAAAVNGFPRQALHAATLGFTHPVSGERLDFSADLPGDMAGLIAVLRAASG